MKNFINWDMDQQIISRVWRLKGLFGRVFAGILIWDNGRVLFITEEGVEFDMPFEQMNNIKWPFLRMGFGFDTVVNGEKYQFSFSKPNHGAPDIQVVPGDPYPSVVFGGQPFYDMRSLIITGTDRSTTKKWKQLLSGDTK